MARLSSEFQRYRTGEARTWIRRHLVGQPFAAALTDPERLLDRSDCRVVKRERRVLVARVELEIDGVATGVFVKRHNAFSLFEQMLSVLRRSRGLRALRAALLLEGAGVPVATALGAVERRRWAMLNKSFSFSQEIVGAETVDLYWRERLKPLDGAAGFERRRRFLDDLAGLLRRLHGARIYHGDFKAKNIVVKPDGAGNQLYVLDLESVRACWYVSRRRRLRNLAQLNRTLGKLLSSSERLYLLRTYQGGGSAKEMRNAVRRIQSMTEKANRRSARRTRS